jgi:hypothetical protein
VVSRPGEVSFVAEAALSWGSVFSCRSTFSCGSVTTDAWPLAGDIRADIPGASRADERGEDGGGGPVEGMRRDAARSELVEDRAGSHRAGPFVKSISHPDCGLSESQYVFWIRSDPAVSEETGVAVVQTAHGVVVENHTADAAVFGKRPRLRLDLLGGEHTGDRLQMRVAVHQLEVAGELIDPVDVVLLRRL